MPLTVEEILRGTEPGRRQSVGVMDVIPIVGDDDDTFAPPDVEVGTSGYGSVNLRNNADRPTFVPPGAGWCVKQAAQDHAIGGGTIVPAKKNKTVRTAMCIQDSQGGLITKAAHEMLVLPALLRIKALAMRGKEGYSKLWDDIRSFNNLYGENKGRGGHLEYFLNAYKNQLDEFVAEFEMVPGQIGAIVMINGHVVGIERSPSNAFWSVLWEPLIRVCYGSLAVKVAEGKKGSLINRIPLQVMQQSLSGLKRALLTADKEENKSTKKVLTEVNKMGVSLEPAEEVLKLGTNKEQVAVSTVSTDRNKFTGQIVTVETQPKYASLFTKI